MSALQRIGALLAFPGGTVRQGAAPRRRWHGICAEACGRLAFRRSILFMCRAVEQNRNEKARCNQAAAHDYTSVHFRSSLLRP